MDEAQRNRPTLPPRTAAQRAWAERLHDLRTPLTVALGRVQLLRRRLRRDAEPARIDADLEVIEAALKRLNVAISKLDRDQNAE